MFAIVSHIANQIAERHFVSKSRGRATNSLGERDWIHPLHLGQISRLACSQRTLDDNDCLKKANENIVINDYLKSF